MSELNWAQWVLIVWTALGVIFAIVTIGKEREPRTPREAAIVLVLSVLSIWLVVEAGR